MNEKQVKLTRINEGESVDGVLKQGPAPAGAAQIRPDDQVEIESNLSYIDYP
jgi:hypothetical protein